MPLRDALSRGLSFSKPKGQKVESSRPGPQLVRSQATASALQRSIQKSTFLNGRQPPKANTPLNSEQILDLIFMLSQPVDTPLLTTSIASLKPPLSRPEKSSPANCLCNVHTWFDLRWIDDLTAVIGEEIGPRLENLRNAPRQLRSVETDEILGMLQNYAHIFPSKDPDSSRMANPYQCNARNCMVCTITSCRACKLSQFFQNEDAVKALNVCAKGRKKRRSPWPDACAWLDPEPGRGWEHKWRKEGLPILSDRIIVRHWRRAGGPERLTAAMASIQAEVMADKEAVEKELERATRLSMKSELTTDHSAYDDIVDRKWTMRVEPMQSSETVNLLRKMGMDDDEETDEHIGERRSDSYETAYHNLVGTSARNSSRPPSRREETMSTLSSALAEAETPWATRQPPDFDRQSKNHEGPGEQGDRMSRASGMTFRDRASRLSRASTVTSRDSVASNTTVTTRSSRTSRGMSVTEPPDGRDVEAWAKSYSDLLGDMPQNHDRLSVCAEGGDQHCSGEASAGSRPVSSVRSSARSRADTNPSVDSWASARSRAHTNQSVDSWAVFNSSPLGRARQTQMMNFIDEQGEERKAPRASTSQAVPAASLNFF